MSHGFRAGQTSRSLRKSRTSPLFLLLLLLAITAGASGGEKIRSWVQTKPSLPVVGNRNTTSPPAVANHLTTSSNIPSASTENAGFWADIDTTTALGATFLVTTTVDTGTGSLRKAIEDANSSPGLNTISFSIGSGPITLTPLSPLPPIISAVVIDGTTQGDYAGTPLIELRGTFLGNGLTLLGGNSTVRGLVINGCNQNGIQIAGIGNNVIEGNYIGTTASGNAPLPNGWSGVGIVNSSGNRVGGTTPAARNVIAGNRASGIRVEGVLSSGNVIQGNLIGLNKDGTAAVKVDSSNGIEIRDGATETVVGGTTAEARNIISGHDYPGIVVVGEGTDGTLITGNYIGTQMNGFTAVPNGDGIRVANGPVGTLIGDGTFVGRNIIAGNSLPGVFLESYPTGPYARGTIIRGNSIGEGVNGIWMRNSVGIEIYHSPGNVIGDTVSGGENRIVNGVDPGLMTSAGGYGVTISGDSSTNNSIRGNRITGNEGGIWIENASGNIIGGPQALAGNVIDQNRSHGLVIRGSASGTVVQGNWIGADPLPVMLSDRGNRGNGILCLASGSTIGGPGVEFANIIGYNRLAGILDSLGTGNRISHNSIFNNVGYGIALGSPSLNINDSLDVDTGPNERQNFPVLDSISYTASTTRIRGHLDSTPGKPFAVEFFGSAQRHASRFGEGETLIGTATITTNGWGRADFSETLPVAVPPEWFITATATDENGNTSQFSRALCMADADGDGLLDIWESKDDGIDVNADGVIDLDLYGKGARSYHKDLFIEVDWMEGHRPLPGVLEKVATAFRQAPNARVHNPDGHPGIELRIDTVDSDSPIPLAAWAADPWPEFYAAKVTNFGSDADRASPNSRYILEAKNLVYRYCIFADSYDTSGSSGRASNIPGSDFFVSLGTFPTPGGTSEEQQGTFMHELGHTLGLGHGGGDDENWKPNYYSLMNYVWQFPHDLVPGSWRLNYSRSALPPLDEKALVERDGLNPGHLPYPSVKVPYHRGDGVVGLARLSSANSPVDWDGNGDSTRAGTVPTIIHNLDPKGPPPPPSVLIGNDDWGTLILNFRNQPEFPIRQTPPFLPSSINATLSSEMTAHLRAYLLTLPPYGIEEPLSDWSGDPGTATPICTAPLASQEQVAASDGHGGAIVAWTFSPEGYGLAAVHVQRIDSLGGVRWPNNGIRLPIQGRGGSGAAIVPDGEGGAFVAWIDRDMFAVPRAPANIYLQRVNDTGRRMWAEGGVQVSAVVTDTSLSIPLLISDGQKGAIVVWRDRHSGSLSVYAQRLDQAGAPLWTAGGVRITSTSMVGWLENVVSDDSSGAIIVWPDVRSPSNVDLYGERIDAAGTLRWGATGAPISAAPSTQIYHSTTRDGFGGAIVTWQDYRAARWEIYAQRVNRAGEVLWTLNGTPVQTGAGNRTIPAIVSDSAGGAIIAWNENQPSSLAPIFAQRINASGSPLWAPGGAVVSDVWRFSNPFTIISDSRHGALLGYSASVSNDVNRTNGVYVQRIDSAGTRMWQSGGTKIAPNGNYDISCAPDNGGGAIVAFQAVLSPSDFYGRSGVFAQKVNDGGGLGGSILTGAASPAEELPSSFELMQNYPNPFNPSTTIAFRLAGEAHVTIVLYDILGRRVRSVVDGRYGAGAFATVWDGRNDGGTPVATGVYFMTMRANGGAASGPAFVTTKKMMLLR